MNPHHLTVYLGVPPHLGERDRRAVVTQEVDAPSIWDAMEYADGIAAEHGHHTFTVDAFGIDTDERDHAYVIGWDDDEEEW